jgi:tripartite-type tricarboxylate transporter receptor subunit TctC
VDLVARILAPRLTEAFGQQVIVDNRPGASGLIGTEIAAKAAADGHTLFLGTTGNLSINQTLFPKLTYDISRAFAPVTQVSSVPFLLYVHPVLTPRNVAEFIAHAKANPGRVHFYSSGNGGLPHLAGELLNSVAGVKTVHVPYKGAAPGVTDLIAGQSRPPARACDFGRETAQPVPGHPGDERNARRIRGRQLVRDGGARGHAG